MSRSEGEDVGKDLLGTKAETLESETVFPKEEVHRKTSSHSRIQHKDRSSLKSSQDKSLREMMEGGNFVSVEVLWEDSLLPIVLPLSANVQQVR
jgi:hypothetical protein